MTIRTHTGASKRVQEDERPGVQSRATLVSNTLTDLQGSAVLVSDGASAALFDNTIRRSGAFARTPVH